MSQSIAMTAKIPEKRQCWSSSLPRADFLVLLFIILILHVILFAQIQSSIRSNTMSLKTQQKLPQPTKAEHKYPEVFIYRRTKKTGSSSMVQQLLNVTKSLGYEYMYNHDQGENDIVRARQYQSKARKLLILNHNSITRDETGGRYTIIVDTIKDGYQQMTSLCRFVLPVKECGNDMIDCLKKRRMLDQNNYRWAGRPSEDEATFINLPLSVAHPALSTTAIRRVFPNVTLDFRRMNVAGSSCPEMEETRLVYNEYYKELEKQVDTLRRRLLAIAGYPTGIGGPNSGFTVADMLDFAEELERPKYDFGVYDNQGSYSKEHEELRHKQTFWVVKDGKLVVSRMLGGAFDLENVAVFNHRGRSIVVAINKNEDYEGQCSDSAYHHCWSTLIFYYSFSAAQVAIAVGCSFVCSLRLAPLFSRLFERPN